MAEKVKEQPQQSQIDFSFLFKTFIITLAVDICVKTNKEEDYFVLPCNHNQLNRNVLQENEFQTALDC